MIIVAIVFARFAETCDTAATMDNEQIFHLLQYYNSSMENIFKFRNAYLIIFIWFSILTA